MLSIIQVDVISTTVFESTRWEPSRMGWPTTEAFITTPRPSSAFLDYMKPAVRLAALNHLPVTFVFTHDSIGLGEDGPTHQPIEHLASLRSLPNTVTLRPCDANETEEAWKIAIERKDGPTVLVLSRQNLPILDAQAVGTDGTQKGAYVLSDAPNGAPEVILMSTGAEVHLALEAQAAPRSRHRDPRCLDAKLGALRSTRCGVPRECSTNAGNPKSRN